jgi:ASC-1-like (ASCH) protein
MTIETAIENYKKEKKAITDRINEYKSKLVEQKALQEKADRIEKITFGDEINYLEREIRRETRMLESYENAFKNVLGNEIGIENITKIMKEYK